MQLFAEISCKISTWKSNKSLSIKFGSFSCLKLNSSGSGFRIQIRPGPLAKRKQVLSWCGTNTDKHFGVRVWKWIPIMNCRKRKRDRSDPRLFLENLTSRSRMGRFVKHVTVCPLLQIHASSQHTSLRTFHRSHSSNASLQAYKAAESHMTLAQVFTTITNAPSVWLWWASVFVSNDTLTSLQMCLRVFRKETATDYHQHMSKKWDPFLKFRGMILLGAEQRAALPSCLPGRGPVWGAARGQGLERQRPSRSTPSP